MRPRAAVTWRATAILPDGRTVLFVCAENSFRSVLSEALFKARAPPGWRAVSAGVAPIPAINPAVRTLLAERRIEAGAKRPQLATAELIEAASRSVTFGCLDRCPRGAEGKAEAWPFPGAAERSMEELCAIRDELSNRIERFIGALPADGSDSSP